MIAALFRRRFVKVAAHIIGIFTICIVALLDIMYLIIQCNTVEVKSCSVGFSYMQANVFCAKNILHFSLGSTHQGSGNSSLPMGSEHRKRCNVALKKRRLSCQESSLGDKTLSTISVQILPCLGCEESSSILANTYPTTLPSKSSATQRS